MVLPDRGQLFGALVLLISALFVSVGLVKPRYQSLLRRASIAAFALALAAILVWSALWLMR